MSDRRDNETLNDGEAWCDRCSAVGVGPGPEFKTCGACGGSGRVRPKPGDRVAVIDAGGAIHRAVVQKYPTGLCGAADHLYVRFDSNGHRSAWPWAFVTTDPDAADRIAAKQRAFIDSTRAASDPGEQP
jgi:hypothetical protein